MTRRRADGFTLLEVIVAVFVFATVMGMLISLVSQNVRRMADARDELHRTRLAEQKLREVLFSAEKGQLPEAGRSQGNFEGDDADLAFEIEVESYAVPAPRETPKQLLESSKMFAGGSGGAPALRRIVVKVFPATGSPDDAQPFVGFVAEKNEPVERAPGDGESQTDPGQDGQDGAQEPPPDVGEGAFSQ